MSEGVMARVRASPALEERRKAKEPLHVSLNVSTSFEG